MEVIAKSHYPKHLHQAGGVRMQFDATGIFRTSNKKEIAVLEKYNELNGRWLIVDRIYTPEEQKKLNAATAKADAIAKKAAKDVVIQQIAEDKLRTELRIKALELGVDDPIKLSIDQLHRVIREKEAEKKAADNLVEEHEKKKGVGK